MMKKIIASVLLTLSAILPAQAFQLTETINTAIADRAKQINCLATAIYKESSGEPFLGQVAVARVVVNRVLHGFAGDPCEVIYQSAKVKKSDGRRVKVCQFSWVCDRNTKIRNKTSFDRAIDIATDVFDNDRWNDIIPNNTLFFHSTAVQPGWKYKKSRKIGNHIFYTHGKTKAMN